MLERIEASGSCDMHVSEWCEGPLPLVVDLVAAAPMRAALRGLFAAVLERGQRRVRLAPTSCWRTCGSICWGCRRSRRHAGGPVQGQDVWLGVQFSLAATALRAGRAAHCWELLEAQYDNLYVKARIPFAAPEGFNASGGRLEYTAGRYFRPGMLWVFAYPGWR